MNYELVKNKVVTLKKEELAYIDNIARISSIKTLSEYEKLEIYRNLKNYKNKLKELLKELWGEIKKSKRLTRENLQDVIIEFDVGKNYLSAIKFESEQIRKDILEDLGIDSETFKYKFTIDNLLYKRSNYKIIDCNIIQNNQRLIEEPIYIFACYYDTSEDCYGPCLGLPDDYIYGIYENLCNEYGPKKEIPKRDMSNFEKNKIIIHSKSYVSPFEIRRIFEEELLNTKNKTVNDCVNQTKNRIEELNYTRSPEYKEKVLLDRINELYKKVKGEFIQKEVLYNGDFLTILRETYKLPNQNIVQKEKILKNDGKNSVIVIALTEDEEYIITFQNRIKDKLIAEFPSGYIERDEDVLEASKRELKEETGYITNDLFVIDYAYTSPGIDNSITYVVVADNCIKTDEKSCNGTEHVKYGLFSKIELDYLINQNIIGGAMNKLAYYNFINKGDDFLTNYVGCKKRTQYNN